MATIPRELDNAAIIDGYALTLITTSYSDEEAADIKGFIDNVTFK